MPALFVVQVRPRGLAVVVAQLVASRDENATREILRRLDARSRRVSILLETWLYAV